MPFLQLTFQCPPHPSHPHRRELLSLEDRATGTNISIGVEEGARSFPLIFAADDDERERWKGEYIARVVRIRTLRSKIGKVKNYANFKKNR